jgi:hypothetical protein
MRQALLVLFLVLGVSACSTTATDSFELSGYVTEEFTEAPLSDARVTFVSDTLFAAETTTDASGQFRLIVVTDQPFGQVRAERDGYQPKEKTVYFDSPVRRIDLTLRPTL